MRSALAADRCACAPHPCGITIRLAADLHFYHSDAGIYPLAQLLLKLVVRIRGKAPASIDRDRVAGRAQKFDERQVK